MSDKKPFYSYTRTNDDILKCSKGIFKNLLTTGKLHNAGTEDKPLISRAELEKEFPDEMKRYDGEPETPEKVENQVEPTLLEKPKTELDKLEEQIKTVENNQLLQKKKEELFAKEKGFADFQEMYSSIMKRESDVQSKLAEIQKIYKDNEEIKTKIQGTFEATQKENTERKQSATTYADEVRRDADNYAITTKEAADTYSTQLRVDADKRQKEIDEYVKNEKSRSDFYISKAKANLESDTNAAKMYLSSREKDANAKLEIYLRTIIPYSEILKTDAMIMSPREA